MERLHSAVATYDWVTLLKAPNLKVCISSGYAVCNGKESKGAVLQKTDLNLYTAKQNGRNQSYGG